MNAWDERDIKAMPSWEAKDESDIGDVEEEDYETYLVKDSRFERVKPLQMGAYYLGQDLFAHNFKKTALTVRSSRNAGRLTLVGTSCIGNLALLKYMARDKDEHANLVILDISEQVAQFWNTTKAVAAAHPEALLRNSLAEAFKSGQLSTDRGKIADLDRFLRALKNEGDIGRQEHEIIFGCADTVFSNELEIDVFFKRILATTVFVPVNFEEMSTEQINLTKTKIAKGAEDTLVFYGSNIYPVLRLAAHPICAWAYALDADHVVACNRGLNDTSSGVQGTKKPKSGWSSGELKEAFNP